MFRTKTRLEVRVYHPGRPTTTGDRWESFVDFLGWALAEVFIEGLFKGLTAVLVLEQFGDLAV